MKKLVLYLIAALALVSCAQQSPTRVLVLYEDGGHHKPFTDAVLPWLNEAAPGENLDITAITKTTPVNEEYLKDFDVVLQLDYAPYGWPDEAVAAFEKYIDEGRGGWVGMHHASLLGEFDGYPMWEWFSDFLGGIRFKGYVAELADGTVCLEAPAHPVLKGLTATFVILDDEWYTYDVNPRSKPDITVLATVDEDSYTFDTPVRMGDHPVIWTNTAKPGRNVYFQFGHSPLLVSNEEFKTLLLNAIHWAGEK